MTKNLETEIQAISEKLDRVIRLLALSVVPVAAPLREKAILLSRTGMAPKEIAEVIGTTPHSVSVEISAAKKRAKPKPKPKSAKRSRRS